jgi:curli biogenesis system outer membrane secretion channel CsgG
MQDMKRMLQNLWVAVAVATSIFFAGCATQAPPVAIKEAPQSVAIQKNAQQLVAQFAVAKPTLKRKIALGRITNETSYGRSLLRDSAGDPLGKQVTDLLSKSLAESGAYLVFERPDISRLQDESSLTGVKLNIIGVDALIIGSLSEFGRKTVGQTGFASSSKKQVAFAKVDLRLVDASTGQIFFATSGAGESSTESASTFGFGSQAAYDGTLNDSAIRQAISEAVSRLSTELSGRPWQTYFLSAESGSYFISGGKAQGLRPGMLFSVQTIGKKIKSPQTGFDITLPGQEVAQVRVDSNFGDTEAAEGSVVSIVGGSLKELKIDNLVIRVREAL